MHPIKIAINGAGIAGLASALFLQQSGHDVTLYEKVLGNKIKIVANQEIIDVKNIGYKTCLINTVGDMTEAYDLDIDCSGMRSALRDKYADIKLNKPYPYGAL